MNLYVSKSECAGKAPVNLNLTHCYARNELITRMLKKRMVARFIVAPACFGKTALIAEYARSVFDFEDMFWFDAKSACFLRDLDEKELLQGVLNRSEKPGLVVFEDVPHLASGRELVFSKLLDALMENGWEVMVSMTPGCDLYADRQTDRILIEAADLLLSLAEMEQFSATNSLLPKPTSFQTFERIPCIFWAESDSNDQWLKRFLKEDLSAEMLLFLFVCFFLQAGSLKSVMRFIKKRDQHLLASLAKHYAYLGIDLQEERFHALPFSAKVLAKEFFVYIDKIAKRSSFSTKSKLLSALADALMETRNHERACQCMRVLAPVAQRKEWLEEQAEVLLQEACFFEPYQVHESLHAAASAQEGKLLAAQAWRLLFLGNEEEACKLASRVHQREQLELEHRTMAALLLARHGNEPAKKRALQYLKTFSGYLLSQDHEGQAEHIEEFLTKQSESWQVLARGFIYLNQNVELGLSYIAALDPESPLALVLTIWLLQDTSSSSERKPLEIQKRDIQKKALCQAVLLLEKHERSGTHVAFLHVLLYQALERMPIISSAHRMSLNAKAFLPAVREIELSLARQQNAYVISFEKRSIKQAEQRQEGQYDFSERGQPIPPMLYVKLFSGVDGVMGERPIDPVVFRRQKVSALFATLVLHQGREISGERLIEALWPGKTPELGKRGFYSAWSILYNALSITPKYCPYLIRLQGRFKINARYVSSDVAEFDALCNKIACGSVDLTAWKPLYDQMAFLYTGDIMPGEYENELIMNLRNEYSNRMIDACVEVGRQLLDKGDSFAALQFGQLIINRTRGRDDAYEMLMQAQLDMGQRASAIETFFKCKTYLVDELGIDPSSQLTALYDRAINNGLSSSGSKEVQRL